MTDYALADPAPDTARPVLIACRECDLLQYQPELRGRFVLRCRDCGIELRHHVPGGLDHTLAYTLGALILFVLANIFPIVGLELNDDRSDVLLYRAVHALFDQGEYVVGTLVGFTTMVVPALELLAIIYILLPLKFGRIPPRFALVYRAVHATRPWGMIEVFMLGVLVSLVKLSNFAHVLPGFALWSFGLLILLMAAVAFSFNPPELWARVDEIRGTPQRFCKPPRNIGSLRSTAKRHGLIRCPSCGQLHRQASTSDRYCRCTRCGAPLVSRKRDSIERTWAFVVTAGIFYIPANVLPIMHTQSLLASESDTILSGILVLWHTGSWPLALLVFFASIVVPLLKLVVITYLLFSVGRRSQWRPKFRSRMHRIVEEIGRWSMLDIYVVTLLAALVQLRGLASVEIERGATAFAVVVIMTMFAAQQLDPRLIWDPIEEGNV